MLERLVSCGTVSARLVEAGVVKRTDIQPLEVERILKLSDAGMSMNKIGQAVGRDPKTVRSVIIAAGLQPPTKA